MNMNHILDRSDVNNLLKKNSIYNYECKSPHYYEDLEHTENTLNKLITNQNFYENYFSEMHRENFNIIRMHETNQYFIIFLNEENNNNLVEYPSRGKNCQHVEYVDFDKLIKHIAIDK